MTNVGDEQAELALLRCKWRRQMTAGRVCQQDRAAFTLLYQYYQRPLGHRLYMLVHDREVASDLYQETFIKVWLHAVPAIGDRFERWLYKVAKHLAIDYVRRAKKFEWIPLAGDEMDWPDYDYRESDALNRFYQFPGWCMDAESLSGQMSEADVIFRLSFREALEELPPTYRICLLLQFQWGLTQREIGVRLHIKEKTVSTVVYRGCTRLEKLFAKKWGSHQTLAAPVRIKPRRSRYGDVDEKRVERLYAWIQEFDPHIPHELPARLLEIWQEEDRP